MAQVYHPKKTSTKYIEGATAGLIGGLVAVVVAVLGDFLTPGRSWWSSNSLVGGIVTGARDFNTASADWGSFLTGVVLTLLAFALIGMSFVNYMPLFRKFKIPPLVGGAIYGLVIWLSIFVLFMNPLTGSRVNLIITLAACVLAGAALAWWLGRMSTTGSPTAAKQQ